MKRVLASILALACAGVATAAAAEPAKETSLTYFGPAGDQHIFISDQPVTWQGRQVSFWMFIGARQVVTEADGKTYVGAWINASIDCTAKTTLTIEVGTVTPDLSVDRRINGGAEAGPIDPAKPVERLRAQYCDGKPLSAAPVRVPNLTAAVRMAQAGGPPAP